MKLPDIDIDVGKRQEVLDSIDFPYALAVQQIINNKEIIPHNVGIYFNDIPKDILSNYATIDYKKATELGFTKIDILPNHIYDSFKNRKEIQEAVSMAPDWNKFYTKNIFETLPQISGYWDLLNDLPKIDSVLKLAMFIAIIRPSKKYLIPVIKKSKDWNTIIDKIWIKENTDEYQFKKSHAIAYALSITTVLNKKGS